MLAKRFVWLGRIKDVEREHSATNIAAIRLLEAARLDSSILQGEVRIRDLEHAFANLDGTYIIRVFAEFETGLRSYWVQLRGTEPPIRNLLESIATLRGVPRDNLADVHSVREYRNVLVHEREAELEPISMANARSRLCKFFARLPDNW
jgi:hypothetical protein